MQARDQSKSDSAQRPAGYSSKPRLQLDPSCRADVACKRLHRALLEILRLNQAGAQAGLDPEYLHDFRVAVRRTRSTLSQVPKVFSPDETRQFEQGFAALGKITGPARDLDVFLLQLDDHLVGLGGEASAGLRSLTTVLQQRQRREQRVMASHLASPKYADLLRDWQEFLNRPSANSPIDGAPNAHRPILEFASQRIWRAYRRLTQRGRKIEPQTSAAAVHRLRIQGKKLRYLLELFLSLYTVAELQPLIAELKQLQDVLGNHNDLDVQRSLLADLTANSGELATATEGDAERLSRYLVKGQQVQRRLFHERFAAFDQPANRQRFRGLFRN